MILKVLYKANASLTCTSVFLDMLATYRRNQLSDIMCYLKIVDRADVNNLGLVLGLQYTTIKSCQVMPFSIDVVTRWLGKCVKQGNTKLEISCQGAQGQASPAKWDCH